VLCTVLVYFVIQVDDYAIFPRIYEELT